ncbi:YidB family protein [Jannaschia sp. CCS1]|uniref:YidB family protein n=1 Tax=Jannaschia sp. (strain CCS1) TaxID=290400 RepID=UPI000053AD9B|nr:YidB family protein [Jannaschia sp. CCS1]ABD55133.1 protein of unknown function DUF937 [Jannaschia sp. CCS1]
MARRGPSLTALLGLLAVAGYQNRDRISEMLGDARRNMQGPTSETDNRPQSGPTSFLSEISSMFTGAAAGRSLQSGLGELFDSFRSSGRGDVADTWMGHSDSQPIDARDLEDTIGQETLDHLSDRTGLSREELLSRLSDSLPHTVNRFTPDGRIPNDDEIARAI